MCRKTTVLNKIAVNIAELYGPFQLYKILLINLKKIDFKLSIILELKYNIVFYRIKQRQYH